MASQSGYNDTGIIGQGISSELGDLPSKRLLGKGLASIGYETEVNGERFARKDFIGVPSDIFEKEAAALVGLEDHENIVKTMGWTLDKTSCSLVLEYMDDSLLDFLRKRKPSQGRPTGSSAQPFELPEAMDIMLQIAIGMEYLHDQGIPHGDLKTKNILVSCVNDGDKNSLSVKVADFGLIRTKRRSLSFVSRQARKLDMVRWKAPEILEKLLSEDNNETSSESDLDSDDENTGSFGTSDWRLLSVDVYSFAVTCSQILTGEDPYQNDLNWKEWVVDIVAGELRPTLPAACPPELRTLLNSCWGMTPLPFRVASSRPTFSYIRRTLEHLVPNRQMALSTQLYPKSYQFDPENVMIVTKFINNLIKGTRTVWACCDEWQLLRDELKVIQPVVLKIETQLFKIGKNLHPSIAGQVNKSPTELYSLKKVGDWYNAVQHALQHTAIDLNKCQVSTLINSYLSSGWSLMSRKVLEHVKEINQLAREVGKGLHLHLRDRKILLEQFTLLELELCDPSFPAILLKPTRKQQREGMFRLHEPLSGSSAGRSSYSSSSPPSGSFVSPPSWPSCGSSGWPFHAVDYPS